MNFFFGISNKNFDSFLTIPKFQNSGFKSEKYFPFEASIVEYKWIYRKAHFAENDDFFFIDKKDITNNKIFFLSNEREVNNQNNKSNKLSFFNNFTKPSPVNFRSNLRITYNKQGFSSYQSEYPFDMIKKKGNILSPISPLLNIDADENFIFFKNIYIDPIESSFKIYFFNTKLKTVTKTVDAFTNKSNLISIEKSYIDNHTYIFSEGFLGIPIYISVKNNHLSFEHTHPPHHYILSEDKFKIISKLKNEIKKQIFS